MIGDWDWGFEIFYLDKDWALGLGFEIAIADLDRGLQIGDLGIGLGIRFGIEDLDYGLWIWLRDLD